MQDSSHPTFAGLLRSAVEEPGTLSSAYHAFHAYSLGNQFLAMFQCHERGLKPGPMATFPRWKELGRHVQRGQKALTLCMPITAKRRPEPPADAADSAPQGPPVTSPVRRRVAAECPLPGPPPR